MILVFRTSVKSRSEANHLAPFLEELVSFKGKWNFDLDDCDKILRIESGHLLAKEVELAFLKIGYQCIELED